mgnify:CR=1 FL=1
MEHIRYKKETEVVTFQGKEITLENLSPVFTPEQEAAKRRELEQQLAVLQRNERSRSLSVGSMRSHGSGGGYDAFMAGFDEA